MAISKIKYKLWSTNIWLSRSKKNMNLGRSFKRSKSSTAQTWNSSKNRWTNWATRNLNKFSHQHENKEKRRVLWQLRKLSIFRLRYCPNSVEIMRGSQNTRGSKVAEASIRRRAHSAATETSKPNPLGTNPIRFLVSVTRGTETCFLSRVLRTPTTKVKGSPSLLSNQSRTNRMVLCLATQPATKTPSKTSANTHKCLVLSLVARIWLCRCFRVIWISQADRLEPHRTSRACYKPMKPTSSVIGVRMVTRKSTCSERVGPQ